MGTKLSALTAASAAMSYAYGIDGTPTQWKIPVNAAWGLHQFDGSGNILPTAPSTGTVGASGNLWAGGFFTTLSSNNLLVTGSAGAGYLQLARNTSAPSTPTLAIRLWTNLNQLNALGSSGFNMKLDFSAYTADRLITFPDVAGTVTLLGSTATGTGSVVLASAPSIDSPTFTTTATGVTQAAGTNSTAVATTAYVDRYTPANPQASAPTTGGTVSPTITGSTTVVQINPAGTLANLTLTLPVGTQPGQLCFVAFSQAITALSVTTTNVTATNGMALPTAATANQAFGFVWSGATSKWTRFL